MCYIAKNKNNDLYGIFKPFVSGMDICVDVETTSNFEAATRFDTEKELMDAVNLANYTNPIHNFDPEIHKYDDLVKEREERKQSQLKEIQEAVNQKGGLIKTKFGPMTKDQIIETIKDLTDALSQDVEIDLTKNNV